MKELTPILLVLLAGAAAYAVHLFRRVAKLKARAENDARLLEDRSQEAEKTRRDVRDRQKELEQTKKLLQEAKTKLKRHQKAAHGSLSGKKDDFEASPQPSVAAIVRVSAQEVEAEHTRAIEKLERELESARDEVSRLRKKEEDRRAETERAARSLASPDPAAETGDKSAREAAPHPARSPAEEIEALASQLDALRKAASERERELKKELRKAHENTNNALKRANNNHQLYQVIKGQLDLAEDRLAQLRRRYEGAKSLDELRRENRRKADSARPAPGAEQGMESAADSTAAAGTPLESVPEAGSAERALVEATGSEAAEP